MRGGSDVTITLGAPTGPRGNRYLYLPVILGAGIMAIALAFALTRRRPTHAAVRRDVPDDAEHLARDIADLDEAFSRVDAPTDAEREAYRQRRQALKTRLTAALANEEVAV
jgi:putative NADH-flavin reductase